MEGVIGGLKIPFEFVASIFVGENFKSGTGSPFTSFPSMVVKHVALTISPFIIRIAHKLKILSHYWFGLF